MIKVLAFDFDGVLLESVAVKDQAFYDLFEDATVQEREKVLALHKRTPGIHRRDKISLLLTEVLIRQATPAIVNNALERFAKLVWDGLMNCPEVAGVRKFLDEISRRLPCYVVSAAPQDELRAVTEKRDFSKYFVDVWGSPPTKAELLQHIIMQEGVVPEEVTLIGDKSSDLKAAQTAGTGFIGRVLPGSDTVFPEEVVVVNSFEENTATHLINKRQ